MNNIIDKFYTILIVSAFIAIAQSSKPEDPTYKVGVVEFNRAQSGNANRKLEENIINAGDILKNNVYRGTHGEDVDIVVFPESVLNTYDNPVTIPDPKDKPILCQQNNPNPQLLETLSCWAITFRKYLIFNMIEKVECTEKSQKEQNDDRPCSDDGLTRYNTNVVFDRQGAIIAKYRKVNPYGEHLINTTLTPDYTIFETDFGVKFGTFICFDLLFKTPAQELVVKHGITDIIFPTYWFSELPFYTANQIQQSWSYGNNINFLAAGGNLPRTGTTGSGIFSGKAGALISRMYGEFKNEMLISVVPKMGQKSSPIYEKQQVPTDSGMIPRRIQDLKLTREDTVDKFISKIIGKEGELKEELCHEDICCAFDLNVQLFDKLDSYKHYYFRMIAYSGTRSYLNGSRTSKYKTCSIIACTDDKSLESCGKVFKDEEKIQNYYYFNKINIDGKFNDAKEVLFMPSTVQQSLYALPVKEFNFTKKDDGTGKSISMQLNNDNSDLLTFGIFAIDYKSSSIKRSFPSIFIIGGTMIFLYFFKRLY